MKILNISTPVIDAYHSYFGGASGHLMYCMFKSLSKYIDLHTLILDTNEPNLPFTYTKVSHSSNTPHFLRYKDLILQLINEHNPDIITHFYFHETEFNPLIRFIKPNNFIIGMVELPHIRLSDELTFKDRLLRLAKPLALNLTKHTINHCNKLITVNHTAKQYYSKYTDNINVIPYGVDHQLFNYQPFPHDKNVLITSRLIRRRRIIEIIRSLIHVKKYHNDITVHIVGTGPLKGYINQISYLNNLNVIFHNNVDINKLKTLLANSYVFCHFSTSDGWNQPVLEAMSTGRPVIATDAPFNSMVKHGKTGFLTKYSLIDYFIYLFDNPTDAKRMGKNARKEVLKNYDWDKIAKEYVKVFEEVY